MYVGLYMSGSHTFLVEFELGTKRCALFVLALRTSSYSVCALSLLAAPHDQRYGTRRRDGLGGAQNPRAALGARAGLA